MIQQFLENFRLPKDLMNILSSFIPSCPKQETARMSIKWIYKQIWCIRTVDYMTLQ